MSARLPMGGTLALHGLGMHALPRAPRRQQFRKNARESGNLPRDVRDRGSGLRGIAGLLQRVQFLFELLLTFNGEFRHG